MDPLKSTIKSTIGVNDNNKDDRKKPPTETEKSGTEPISGEMGEGTAGEPFDQGNVQGKHRFSLKSFGFWYHATSFLMFFLFN